MNREIVERLAMDRAAGELSPDVTALFEYFLAHEPALALQARETEETLRLAKQALAAPVVQRLPTPNFANPRMIKPREFSPPRHTPLWAFGMAACFVGGLMSGSALLQDRQISGAHESVTKAAVVANAAPAQPGFWSIDRLASRDATARPTVASPLIWKSPVRAPELRTQ